jgi:hypothetical protein
METKTSQLQIRVTPAEKAALKRMAEGAGLSVSAFVLHRALPGNREALDRRIRALEGGKNISRALSDLQLHLQTIAEEEFATSVAAVETDGLTPLQANCAAAAVEGEAWRRGQTPPDWVRRVDPLERPHFGWGLRSLRPHLMRVTRAPFKRRNVYIPHPDDPRQ